MYLGIDIGGTSVKMAIVSKVGEILTARNFDVAFDNYETPIIETVKKGINIFLNDNEIEAKTLDGICISATGQIDSNNGIVIGVGGNIKNWYRTEIKKEVEECYGVNTTVVNDANCMVIGEQWIGGAKGYKNVIGITIGTGVGGGIIVDSKILLGTVGIAGEIGHFSINSKGKNCTCGNSGCYEQYASMTALIKSVKEKYNELGKVEIDVDNINGKSIFKELEKGNEKIEIIVNNWVNDIGRGLVSLIHIFNPEIILIGGGVCKQEKLFIEPIRKYVLENAMSKFTKNLKIESAKLGNDAGIIGAVNYYINR